MLGQGKRALPIRHLLSVLVPAPIFALAVTELKLKFSLDDTSSDYLKHSIPSGSHSKPKIESDLSRSVSAATTSLAANLLTLEIYRYTPGILRPQSQQFKIRARDFESRQMKETVDAR